MEEEIDRADDSDLEAPSPSNVGISGMSLGESATEMSVSDRSVDGSMALEGFDHIEPVGGR